MDKSGTKQIAANRKAYHDYFVEEKLEAGISLKGTEVKSLRAGTVSMKDCFCQVKNGELFVYNMHISPYEKGNIFNTDPMRVRKLLVHKREILKLQQQVMQKGMALVPLALYFKNSKVKLELGVCRGKKLYDKRDSAAEREAEAGWLERRHGLKVETDWILYSLATAIASVPWNLLQALVCVISGCVCMGTKLRKLIDRI